MSLFVSLALVILGSRNKYCLSFGFICLGISLILFELQINEKYKKIILQINEEIDELDADEEIEEEDKVYILQQLYIRQKQISKQQKRMKIVFPLFGISIILFTIFGMF